MINIRMQNKDVQKLTPKITVIGVGGAGGNAVNNMISSGLQGASFLVCNTDAQALEGSLCDVRLQLGLTVTGGLGAGARPEIGRTAAEESLDDVMQYLEGANMAFITAGMGGGTGTGAAPVIARACREKGVLTVGVVTKPFHFEGTTRMRMAEAGIEEMQQYVDTLIVIPNQNLFRVANEKTTFAEAFRLADSVLQSGVRGVTDLMVMPGLINLDFADIRSAMLEMGKAMMGTGEASGDRRAIEAAEAAINNPLLDDVSMKGARGVIINVTGGYDMTLFEVDEACNRIRDEVDPNANIIFGSTFDESLEGVMRVSVVATGIDVAEEKARRGGHGSRGVSINNTTAALQQERRIERVQTTEIVAETAAPVQGRIPLGSGMPLPMNARPVSSSIPSAPPVAPRRVEVPENSFFGQQQAVEVERRYEPAVEPAAHVQASYVQHAPQQAAASAAQGTPRGTVYNESFIPPAPMEVESRPVDPAYGPQLGALSARRMIVDPSAAAAPSANLTLRPPVPGGQQQQSPQQAPAARRRPPSLFERFTNQLLHHGDDERDDRGSAGETGSASSGNAPRQVQRPVQGSLNIEAPKAGELDDELDIPAFLRRQAN